MAMTWSQALASKTDPSSGCELRHATTLFSKMRFTLPSERLGLNGGASDITIDTRYYATLEWRSLIKRGQDGALNPLERNLLLGLRISLLEDLLNKLRDGVLVARGFRSGEIETSELPAIWWNACSPAQIDVRDNSAEANGTRLTGIWVYPTETVAPRVSAGTSKKVKLTRAIKNEYLARFPDRASRVESEEWARSKGHGPALGRQLWDQYRNGHRPGRPQKPAVSA